jgi:hypothetical protein
MAEAISLCGSAFAAAADVLSDSATDRRHSVSPFRSRCFLLLFLLLLLKIQGKRAFFSEQEYDQEHE